MTATAPRNGSALAEYIAGASQRPLPPEVTDMARLCLADWLGVSIGAADEPAGHIVREVAASWRSEGRATVLFGAPAAAPFAALANGTLAHCLDFDDTYVRAITHTSAPVWAATLALGEENGADEATMLSAFVTGFETAARIGDGLGERADLGLYRCDCAPLIRGRGECAGGVDRGMRQMARGVGLEAVFQNAPAGGVNR